jgi:hypothetical protein
VKQQRRTEGKGKLSPARKARLDELGFEWSRKVVAESESPDRKPSVELTDSG